MGRCTESDALAASNIAPGLGKSGLGRIQFCPVISLFRIFSGFGRLHRAPLFSSLLNLFWGILEKHLQWKTINFWINCFCATSITIKGLHCKNCCQSKLSKGQSWTPATESSVTNLVSGSHIEVRAPPFLSMWQRTRLAMGWTLEEWMVLGNHSSRWKPLDQQQQTKGVIIPQTGLYGGQVSGHSVGHTLLLLCLTFT